MNTWADIRKEGVSWETVADTYANWDELKHTKSSPGLMPTGAEKRVI